MSVQNLLWVHAPRLSYLKLLVAIMEKATLRLSSPWVLPFLVVAIFIFALHYKVIFLHYLCLSTSGAFRRFLHPFSATPLCPCSCPCPCPSPLFFLPPPLSLWGSFLLAKINMLPLCCFLCSLAHSLSVPARMCDSLQM